MQVRETLRDKIDREKKVTTRLGVPVLVCTVIVGGILMVGILAYGYRRDMRVKQENEKRFLEWKHQGAEERKIIEKAREARKALEERIRN